MAKEYLVNPYGRKKSYPIRDDDQEIIWSDIMNSEGIQIKLDEKIRLDFDNSYPTFIHSLKHALINAAPKYTGVTRNEFIGIIQPNSDTIIIADAAEGGSGACRLFYMYFDKIWELAYEILKKTDNIFLEINCEQWNKDLDPKLVRKYFEYYKNETKGL